MPDVSADNNKVTLAVLNTNLEHLQEKFSEFRQEMRTWRLEDREERKQDRQAIDDLCNRVTRNEEKLRNTTGVLGALQLILAAVAAWIGVQR